MYSNNPTFGSVLVRVVSFVGYFFNSLKGILLLLAPLERVRGFKGFEERKASLSGFGDESA